MAVKTVKPALIDDARRAAAGASGGAAGGGRGAGAGAGAAGGAPPSPLQRLVDAVRREVDIHYTLRSVPGVLPVHGLVVDEAADVIGVVMDLADSSLRNALDAGALPSLQHGGAPALRLCVGLLLQVAAALEAMQRRTPAFTHADIKAANVLMRWPCTAQLSDFGFCRVHANLTASLAHVNMGQSSAHAKLGTPLWRAPEILEHEALVGEPQPCAATDVFSFGMLMYEVLSGCVPFGKSPPTSEMRLYAHLKSGARPSEGLPSGAAMEPLLALMRDCWEWSSGDRPEHMGIVAGRLRAIMKALGGGLPSTLLPPLPPAAGAGRYAPGPGLALLFGDEREARFVAERDALGRALSKRGYAVEAKPAGEMLRALRARTAHAGGAGGGGGGAAASAANAREFGSVIVGYAGHGGLHAGHSQGLLMGDTDKPAHYIRVAEVEALARGIAGPGVPSLLVLDCCYSAFEGAAPAVWRVDEAGDSLHDSFILRAASEGMFGYSNRDGSYSFSHAVEEALGAWPEADLQRVAFEVGECMRKKGSKFALTQPKLECKGNKYFFLQAAAAGLAPPTLPPHVKAAPLPIAPAKGMAAWEVVALMRAAPADERVAKGGVVALLDCVGEGAAQVEACRAAGGLDAVLAALKQFSRTAAIAEPACGVVWFIASTGAGQDACAASGAAGAVHSALRECASDASVVRQACGAIKFMAWREEHRDGVVAAGAVQLLVAAVAGHAGEARWEARNEAREALERLGYNDAGVQLTGYCVAQLGPHGSSASGLAVVGGQLVSGGGESDHLSVWDSRTGRKVATMAGRGYRIAALPGGRFATAPSNAPTAAVWDAATATRICELQGHTENVMCVASVPGDLVATGSCDNTVRIWRAATGAHVATLEGHVNYVWALAMLPDCRLASVALDGTVRLWDLSTRRCTAVLQHTYSCYALAALEGGCLASGDRKIHLWNTTSGACEALLEGHTNRVESLAALPQGLLASGSADKTVRVWNVAARTCVAVLQGHTSGVLGLAALPDGRLASGSDDKDDVIRVWELRP